MVQKQTTSEVRGAREWVDLPVVLALRRHGTARAAAAALGVSHSTVLRRLATAEAGLGVRLFGRAADGRFEPTPAGEDAVETGEHLDDLLMVMERRIQGRDLELAGPLLVTMPPGFLPMLARELGAFAARYPKIELSVTAGLAYADLAHREADVALRITPSPSPELVGRRLADVHVGVYGSAAYLATQPARTPLARHRFIGWDPSLAQTAFARWIDQNVPADRIRCRIGRDWQVRDAVDADLGLTLVPCAQGDLQPGWRRVKLLPALTTPLWLLTHRDLRATARMRALRDALADAVLAKRALVEGRRPQRP
jgi:DNA-binding transcriptional LysR family regulator